VLYYCILFHWFYLWFCIWAYNKDWLIDWLINITVEQHVRDITQFKTWKRTSIQFTHSCIQFLFEWSLIGWQMALATDRRLKHLLIKISKKYLQWKMLLTCMSRATISVYGSWGATVDDLRKRSRNGITCPPRRNTGTCQHVTQQTCTQVKPQTCWHFSNDTEPIP